MRFQRVSVTAYNSSKSLSNETATFDRDDFAARMQSAISIFESSYFSNASRISDLQELTILGKFNISLNDPHDYLSRPFLTDWGCLVIENSFHNTLTVGDS